MFTAPIRGVDQVVIGQDGCPGQQRLLLHILFTSSDLLNWKHPYGPYSQKPWEVTDLIHIIMKMHNPDWSDIQQLMGTIFNPEEREKIRWAVAVEIKGNIPDGHTW